MCVDSDRDALVLMSTLVEPGNADVAHTINTYGPIEALDRLLAPGDSTAHRSAVARLGRDSIRGRLEQVTSATQECGARVLTEEDEEWPVRLADLSQLHDESEPHSAAPRCLWVRGGADLAEVTARSVSIVGARACSWYGKHVATQLAHDLADRGWGVLSGGAYGIDAAAHRGALAAEGNTVAVLASGVDRPYPAGHDRLFDSIRQRGLLVSEWPPGSIPQRHRFLVRNRVIAAMSMGTVVVEAAIRSGARQTARKAKELERTLMLVPGSITSAASAGVHQLAREPGEVRIVTRAAEIIEDVGDIGSDLAPPLPGETRPQDLFTTLEYRLWDAAPRKHGATADEIAAQAGIAGIEARRVLPGLARDGHLEFIDGRYRQPVLRSASGRYRHGRDDTGQTQTVIRRRNRFREAGYLVYPIPRR